VFNCLLEKYANFTVILYVGFRPPPPPYEMPSPANSTTSSYLNKNLNSVEPVPTPQPNQRTAEASSLVLNILLTDTAFNIFRDHNFDSCTLCVCNAGPKVGTLCHNIAKIKETMINNVTD